MDTGIPEVRFDPTRAIPIYPRPVRKHAVLIPIPLTQDGMTVPTFIRPEWGGVQVFYGDYYGVVAGGKVAYGSAKEQWEAMHTALEPGYWVKTAIPTAYQATERCRIVTLIPSEDGAIREANYVLEPGDWIVGQPGGEVQHIKAAKFAGVYFTAAEATRRGLDSMSPGQFAVWAASKALASARA